MSRQPHQYSLTDVLDILAVDGNESEVEGFSSSSEAEEDFIPQDPDISSESDQDVDEVDSEGGGWESSDDAPLQNIAKLTSKENYKWRNRAFEQPNDIEFCGDTSLPELPRTKSGMVTPYSLFKMFVTDDMLESATEQTNRYSVEKNGSSINMTCMELEKLIGMIFYMGLVNMPNLRSYWESELRYEPVANVMARDRFLKLLTLLHFVGNNEVSDEEKVDKLWKLRPWFEALRQNFLKIPPKEFQSVDEIIIPFKGRSGLKVYMPNKPHKWGFKFWGRSDSDGFIYDLDLYQPIPNEMVSELGRSAGVVEKLTDSLQSGKNFKVFADNFFSSVSLAEKLKKRGIWYVGTVRMNRVVGNSLPKDKELQKKPRGHFVAQVEQNTNVACVRWNDNKIVSLISTYVATDPVTNARRWDKKKKIYIDIDRPKIVEEYNKFMGGIDLLNMCTNLYKYHIKSRRWYIYIFHHSVTVALVNAWFLYRRYHQELGTNKKEVLPLRKFQAACAYALTSVEKQKKRGRPSLEQASQDEQVKPQKKRYVSVPEDVKKDEVNHLPIFDSSRQRCKLCPRSCNAFSYVKCMKCDAHLCLNKDRNCFKHFHK